MNYENLDKFMNFLKENVKIVRVGVVFDALKHDKRFKEFVGVKKLRKSAIYNYSQRGIILGKGSLVVYDPDEVRRIADNFFKDSIRS
ncbi:hypothetical protein [Acidianus bottle-shaped virus]|uniref:Uncharacterized protein ORF86 n=1 Tax=Acidianus bottle-shaped virus (isolate Italy/Pozzuoli) TaxID=654911 RepID=Y086_ABVP|nr:hypothetical protein ABV_gp32 [Acidianus bottle-shaped virus]A4ZUB8.1 RecName: Full=Uncharacterized protein ORF86 [Acidianus bottle-shaped virus (isolate Pozzuoli)]ABP73422.1 hypothetical protein [Acidianus bottle-shaped virus]